jgi:hypothetical protein
VYEIVDTPQGRHLMDSKLVFTVKTNANQEVTRFKVRLVARGFTQIAGIDYSETYSSVASIAAIRSLIAMAINMNCVIKQLDVKTAYLYASVDEELYMKIPACVPVTNKNQCWKLKKALYGTKQGAKCWYNEIKGTALKLGFKTSVLDESVFYKENIWLVLYVDDILVMSTDNALCEKLIDQLKKFYQVTVQDRIVDFLQMEWTYSESGISIGQSSYVVDSLTEIAPNGPRYAYPMSSGVCVTVKQEIDNDDREFRILIGKLLYLQQRTRPDISIEFRNYQVQVDTLNRFTGNGSSKSKIM